MQAETQKQLRPLDSFSTLKAKAGGEIELASTSDESVMMSRIANGTLVD